MYTPHVVVTPSPGTGKSVFNPPTTNVEFLDIPLLRDADNSSGFYVAACGEAGWRGAVLFKSIDDGVSYANVATASAASTIGSATTALGNWLGANVFDEANSVTVSLVAGASLASTTELAVLNGANAAALGDEIIQFKNAVLVSAGIYKLTGLLRGRRGTESFMGSHAIGDRFVVLNSALIRVPLASSEIGVPRTYKAVTIGSTLGNTYAFTITNTDVGLKPYSPVYLRGDRNAALDLTITAIRRGRISNEWRDLVEVPIGEVTESYDVEIWNSAFTILKRTFAAQATLAVTYTIAQQTTDFGGAQNPVYVRAYQNSATVGRGYVLQGSI